MLTIEEKRARLTEIRAERNRRIGQIADLDMRLADGAAEAVEGAMRRDRAGLCARYLAAVADEHYRSAFGLLLSHPQDANLRMTTQQAAAVRAVHEATEARAMAEGVGSTGGFGVPF